MQRGKDKSGDPKKKHESVSVDDLGREFLSSRVLRLFRMLLNWFRSQSRNPPPDDWRWISSRVWLVLGAGFLHRSFKLWRSDDDSEAMRTFGYSIIYLMALFAFLLIDHYVPLMLGMF